MIDSPGRLVQEELPEDMVVRILARRLSGDEDLAAIMAALFDLVEAGEDRLIVDFTAVEYVGSAAVGMLLTLRRKLMAVGNDFRPPSRRRGLFAFFRDEAEAVEAIRRGETEPLVLCGVSPQVMEVFQVC